ncbi:double-stranded RNA-specific editase B2-like [Megalops cyprinoides]|uniref:double-stranded RNA-specific editase B2-like n=1 Tax=Megalops cyprinoides TaxID=118141 RepID=UPI0018650EF1|nr:double-stranded RNA-specific editase B2-like [Megalops cyprinoides]
MLSAFIGPFKYLSTGTTSTEDEDTLSTSSVEVKENRDIGNLEDCAIGPRHRQSLFRPDIPRGGTSCLKRKRPLEEGNGSPVCTVYKKLSWSVAPKNALVQLNELKPGLQYKMVSQTGPVHAPLFAIRVEVNGLAFEGTGPTKKKAKMRAAELALKSFIQFPNASQAHLSMGSLGDPATDFTSDQADFPDTLFKGFEPLACGDGFPRWHGRVACHTLDLRQVQAISNQQGAPSCPEGGKSPVALLNELRPGLRYACLADGTGSGRVRSFVMAVRVDGRIFEGCGRSKKLAKTQAAQAALQALFGIGLGPERRGMHTASRTKGPHLPQDFAGSVFRLVTEKYQELADSCSPLHARHKVLAGIVMTRGLDIRQAQVVALSTGTKCINGEYISDQGLVVNDSHAEIIARRALVRYLYSQLELFLSKRPEDWERSIFVRRKEGAGYRLRDNVLFHMYISTSPCGDARLNCPYEHPSDLRPNQRLAKRFHGHLRAKIESGEGTLRVRARGTAQMWDAVLQGEQLVTMSCTDKIARWNVLGVQGSLLTHFLEPVYLSSLTIGSLGHTGHLARTVTRRLEGVGHLPAPYRRNRPLLSCLSGSDSRQAGKSPSFGVNWTAGDGGLEVLNAATGRRKDSGGSSRLCKRALFARWVRIYHKVSLGVRAPSLMEMPPMYCEAKLAAGTYQSVKQQLVRSLQEAGLGTWVKKPPEQEQFLLCV